MKKILLSILLVTLGMAAISQSLSLSYEGNTLEPGETIQVVFEPDVVLVSVGIACTNNNSSALDVIAKKVIHEGDTVPLTSNYFCWNACFPPFVYEGGELTIEPGATNEAFTGDYEPKGIPGISTITYVFFDANNPDDSVAVTVEFNGSPAGLGNELLSQLDLSDAYPNPASTVACVDYDLPYELQNSTLVVTNLLGAKVREIQLNGLQGRLDIPVYDLQDGLYFYTLETQNNLAVTKKFVVRH